MHGVKETTKGKIYN